MYVDALFKNIPVYNTSCDETVVNHREGSYYVCNLLSNRTSVTPHTHTHGHEHGHGHQSSRNESALDVAPQPHVPHGHKRNSSCLAVSVGIGGIWNLEDQLAATGCTVVAFDPTKELRAAHVLHARKTRGVHFHYLGLGASPDVETTLVAAKVLQKPKLARYGSIDSSTMATLDTMLRIARETATRTTSNDTTLHATNGIKAAAQAIDLLKIDCEGCEWDAFEDLALRTPNLLGGVRQIMIELHLRGGVGDIAIAAPSPNGTMSSSKIDEIINRTKYAGWRVSTGHGLIAPQQFDTLMHHLLVDHGFRVSHATQHPGGGKTLKYTQPPPRLHEAGFPVKLYCCVEMTLVR